MKTKTVHFDPEFEVRFDPRVEWRPIEHLAVDRVARTGVALVAFVLGCVIAALLLTGCGCGELQEAAPRHAQDVRQYVQDVLVYVDATAPVSTLSPSQAVKVEQLGAKLKKNGPKIEANADDLSRASK